MQATKEKVLCVVNEDEDCSHLFAALHTFEVTIVRSAAEALSLARGGRLDLYLMNRSLPKGTGYDLCRQLREFDADTPVLFLKDADDEDDRREVARAGAQGVFVSEAGLDGLMGVASRIIKGDSVKKAAR